MARVRHLVRRDLRVLRAGVPEKYTDAQENESTSFLPGDAESTKALTAAEELQGGELAPAVILYRRESGLTAADKAEDRRRRRAAHAAALRRRRGRRRDRGRGRLRRRGARAGAARRPRAAAARRRRSRASRATTRRSSDRCARRTARPRSSSPTCAATATSATLLDPLQFWRETVSDPGGGLEVKITGGAGYAADAIEVFENINGTLLFAATLLVIVLLILIYRSPIFLFIPLSAVIFAEFLSQTLGYGLAELGVTINGQSSAIMSILVLGAGTDYALLIVARYREEMHRVSDKYAAMRAALISAGPAVFASAATVIAALFCLSLARVNGTSGLGPLGALGVFCAALSMLTLLPALLLIFGRRAFWPFVPHTPETRPREERSPRTGASCWRPRASARWPRSSAPAWSCLSCCRSRSSRRSCASSRAAACRRSSRCSTGPSSRPTSCGASSTSTRSTRPTASGSASATAWP